MTKKSCEISLSEKLKKLHGLASYMRLDDLHVLAEIWGKTNEGHDTDSLSLVCVADINWLYLKYCGGKND